MINIGTPPVFEIDVQNTGKVPYRTGGRIEITTINNEPISKIVLSSVSVSPGSIRKVETRSRFIPPPGIYKCSVYVSCVILTKAMPGFNGISLGRLSRFGYDRLTHFFDFKPSSQTGVRI
jgi:hypothetical protein